MKSNRNDRGTQACARTYLKVFLKLRDRYSPDAKHSSNAYLPTTWRRNWRRSSITGWPHILPYIETFGCCGQCRLAATTSLAREFIIFQLPVTAILNRHIMLQYNTLTKAELENQPLCSQSTILWVDIINNW